MKHKFAYATVILFCICIYGFFALYLLLPQQDFSQLENRYLKKFPPLSLDSFGKSYLNDWEASYNDHFPLRDSFISLKAMQNLVLGKGEHNGVYFGKEHYLITQMQSYDEVLLSKNISNINNFTETLSIPAYFMAVPSTHTIAQDYMPLLHDDIDERVLWKQMQNKLSNKLHMVNLFDVFSQHAQEPLYYRSDHHWTSLGSYYAYTAYLQNKQQLPSATYEEQVVSENFHGSLYAKSAAVWIPKESIMIGSNPQQVRVEYEQDGIWNKGVYTWDNLKNRDAYTFFLDGNHSIVQIKNDAAKENRHILIIRDSFAQSFAPFLANDVAHITLLDLRYYKASIQDYIQEHEVDEVLFLYSMDTLLHQSEFSFLR